MDTGDIKDSKKKPPKKGKQGKSSSRWAVQVFFIAVTLSAALSFASDQALDGAGLAVAFVVLLAVLSASFVHRSAPGRRSGGVSGGGGVCIRRAGDV